MSGSLWGPPGEQGSFWAPKDTKFQNFKNSRLQKNQIIGSVIYIDNYGNVVTNIKHSFFKEASKGRKYEISARNHKFKKIYNNYSEIVDYTILEEKRNDEGRALALFNSSNYLEIAIYKSNPLNVGTAASLLGLKILDSITINFLK